MCLRKYKSHPWEAEGTLSKQAPWDQCQEPWAEGPAEQALSCGGFEGGSQQGNFSWSGGGGRRTGT